jgi:hypothetical protein
MVLKTRHPIVAADAECGSSDPRTERSSLPPMRSCAAYKGQSGRSSDEHKSTLRPDPDIQRLENSSERRPSSSSATDGSAKLTIINVSVVGSRCKEADKSSARHRLDGSIRTIGKLDRVMAIAGFRQGSLTPIFQINEVHVTMGATCAVDQDQASSSR